MSTIKKDGPRSRVQVFLELKVLKFLFLFDGMISHAIMQAQLNHSGPRYLGKQVLASLPLLKKKGKRRGRSQRYMYVHVR